MPNVVFVCWGNICRSPMAERVAEKYAAEAGIDARFTSSGVSSEEVGNPIDPRAEQWLADHGYRTGDHRARRTDAAEVDAADLVVAMEPLHADRIRRLSPARTDHIHLLSDFDPDAEPGSGVPDPWYGDSEGFGETLRALEAAMPGLMDAVDRTGVGR